MKKWRVEPFQLFENGRWWIPPPVPQDGEEEDEDDEEEEECTNIRGDPKQDFLPRITSSEEPNVDQFLYENAARNSAAGVADGLLRAAPCKKKKSDGGGEKEIFFENISENFQKINCHQTELTRVYEKCVPEKLEEEAEFLKQQLRSQEEEKDEKRQEELLRSACKQLVSMQQTQQILLTNSSHADEFSKKTIVLPMEKPTRIINPGRSTNNGTIMGGPTIGSRVLQSGEQAGDLGSQRDSSGVFSAGWEPLGRRSKENASSSGAGSSKESPSSSSFGGERHNNFSQRGNNDTCSRNDARSNNGAEEPEARQTAFECGNSKPTDFEKSPAEGSSSSSSSAGPSISSVDLRKAAEEYFAALNNSTTRNDNKNRSPTTSGSRSCKSNGCTTHNNYKQNGGSSKINTNIIVDDSTPNRCLWHSKKSVTSSSFNGKNDDSRPHSNQRCGSSNASKPTNRGPGPLGPWGPCEGSPPPVFRDPLGSCGSPPPGPCGSFDEMRFFHHHSSSSRSSRNTNPRVTPLGAQNTPCAQNAGGCRNGPLSFHHHHETNRMTTATHIINRSRTVSLNDFSGAGPTRCHGDILLASTSTRAIADENLTNDRGQPFHGQPRSSTDSLFIGTGNSPANSLRRGSSCDGGLDGSTTNNILFNNDIENHPMSSNEFFQQFHGAQEGPEGPASGGPVFQQGIGGVSRDRVFLHRLVGVSRLPTRQASVATVANLPPASAFLSTRCASSRL